MLLCKVVKVDMGLKELSGAWYLSQEAIQPGCHSQGPGLLVYPGSSLCGPARPISTSTHVPAFIVATSHQQQQLPLKEPRKEITP